MSLGDVRFEVMTLPDALAATTLNSTDGLDDAVVVHDLRAGELVGVTHLAASAASPLGSVHEITFAIPLDRSPAGLTIGDRVTIFATHDARTVRAVEAAEVTAVDLAADRLGRAGQGLLTLALDDPVAVMELAHLTQLAEITVIRSTRALHDRFPQSVGDEETDS